MKLARRGFLRIMGAAPLAARAAVEQETLHLAGVGRIGSDGAAPMAGPAIAGDTPGLNQFVPYEQRATRAVEYVRMFGLPQWLEDDIRDRARYVPCLDYDIAVQRSWSTSYKFVVQRQRNYERERQRIENSGMRQKARNTLTKLLGFEWPF